MTGRGLALGVALLAAAGCLPSLRAESTAPAGRIARLDAETGFWGIQHYRLELSQGVALAVSCDQLGPCERLTARSDDPAIAEVRPAALTALRPAGGTNQQPAAAVVIVGKAPGKTAIRVDSKDGGRQIWVTVVPPPGAVAATTAKRRSSSAVLAH